MCSESRLALICLDVKLGEKETAGARELARFVRDARSSGRIPERVWVALLCPQQEILQALLNESRRETLGRGTIIFADFELPGALDFAKRFGADCVSFGVSRRLWVEFRAELEGFWRRGTRAASTRSSSGRSTTRSGCGSSSH